MNNRTTLIALAGGFAATLIGNTILALVALAPINDDLGIARTKEQGLNFPALLLGYLALAAFLVWMTPRITARDWKRRGLIVGTATALANSIAGHLIVTGWSVAHLAPMTYAAIIDSCATIAGALVVSRLLTTENPEILHS